MPKNNQLNIGPQKDVLTLEEGKKYTGNWKAFINQTVYQGKDENMPHGFFIPFKDIMELAKLQKKVKSIWVKNGRKYEKKRIRIVGVRAYHSIKVIELEPIGKGAPPISARKYPIDAVLVPVYKFIDSKTQYKEEEFILKSHLNNFDLIVPVSSIKDGTKPFSSQSYTIYDITQPCPPLCDPTSAIF